MADLAIRLALDLEGNELRAAEDGEGSWTLGRSFSSMWQHHEAVEGGVLKGQKKVCF